MQPPRGGDLTPTLTGTLLRRCRTKRTRDQGGQPRQRQLRPCMVYPPRTDSPCFPSTEGEAPPDHRSERRSWPSNPYRCCLSDPAAAVLATQMLGQLRLQRGLQRREVNPDDTQPGPVNARAASRACGSLTTTPWRDASRDANYRKLRQEQKPPDDRL